MINWKNKALKRVGLKGEHAYLEGVEDVKKAILKKLKHYKSYSASKTKEIIKNL